MHALAATAFTPRLTTVRKTTDPLSVRSRVIKRPSDSIELCDTVTAPKVAAETTPVARA